MLLASGSVLSEISSMAVAKRVQATCQVLCNALSNVIPICPFAKHTEVLIARETRLQRKELKAEKIRAHNRTM